MISEDESKEQEISRILDQAGEGEFRLKRFVKLEVLKELELETFCDIALIDLNLAADRLIPFLHWIEDLHGPVPLVAVCENLEALRSLKQARGCIDDYLLTDQAEPGEIASRIDQVLRQRAKIHFLYQEQNLLNSLLDTLPDAVYFKNRTGKFTKVNRAMAENYGKSLDDLIGKSDFDVFNEARARLAYEDDLDIVNTGKSIVGKTETEDAPDGSTIWVSSTKMPLKDRNGNIIGTMGISRDITQLQKIQRKREQQRALLRVIIDHAPAGIFHKDIEGRFLLVNQKHADYIGAESPEAVIGKTVDDFFLPEVAEKIDAADREIMESRTAREGILDHRAVPGKPECWMLTSKVPLLDAKGECTGMVGISLDVTKQKEDEQALKDAFATLEETKLQLIEAEKLKSVGRMAAGVAHEVKNPLNIISLGLDYLKSNVSEPTEVIETMEDMSSAMDSANRVISELLDYSAPRDLQMEPVDLNESVDRVLALLRHSLQASNIQVECDFCKNLPKIEGDPAKLEQALVNICLNAINAMGDGGTLTLRSYSHRMVSAGDNVSSQMTECFGIGDTIASLEISDTGHGIDKEHAAKLFDPFFSTKATGGNTGLGLTVTRNIIEIHRAVLTLKNNESGPGAKASLHFRAID
ncbi:MAG: PAS domain-containing protein [Opitutales bacterium]